MVSNKLSITFYFIKIKDSSNTKGVISFLKNPWINLYVFIYFTIYLSNHLQLLTGMVWQSCSCPSPPSWNPGPYRGWQVSVYSVNKKLYIYIIKVLNCNFVNDLRYKISLRKINQNQSKTYFIGMQFDSYCQ